MGRNVANECLLSQAVKILSSLKYSVFKVNISWRNNISFKKETEKTVKFRTGKQLCTFLSSVKHPFEEHEILCFKYRVATL